MITVFSSLNLVDVQLVKSILDSTGIESSIIDENISSVAPHYRLVVGGIKLVVSESDFSKAKEIVDDYLLKTQKPIRERVKGPINVGRCPKCGSRNITISKIPLKLPSLLATLWFMLPIPISKRYFQCSECGAYWKMKKSTVI